MNLPYPQKFPFLKYLGFTEGGKSNVHEYKIYLSRSEDEKACEEINEIIKDKYKSLSLYGVYSLDDIFGYIHESGVDTEFYRSRD